MTFREINANVTETRISCGCYQGHLVQYRLLRYMYPFKLSGQLAKHLFKPVNRQCVPVPVKHWSPPLPVNHTNALEVYIRYNTCDVFLNLCEVFCQVHKLLNANHSLPQTCT